MRRTAATESRRVGIAVLRSATPVPSRGLSDASNQMLETLPFFAIHRRAVLYRVPTAVGNLDFIGIFILLCVCCSVSLDMDDCSTIFRPEARPFRNPRQHSRAQFLSIMECENEVRPAFAGEGSMRPGLSLDPPADAQERGKQASCLGTRPLAHAALKEMLRRSDPASPWSSRSATTRSARACALARASSAVLP
jgi:hypothetical protein